MDSVHKTLYISLYGKAYVSRKGLFLSDKKAEEIWDAEGFCLKGRAKSKWLAYYMGIRAAVFDEWVKEKLAVDASAVVLHIGCGMDSRVCRVNATGTAWYDVDFPQVIQERHRYYTESDSYKMLAGDARSADWLQSIPKAKSAVVVMEGVGMYLTTDEMLALTKRLCAHFERVALLMDAYSVFAAKMSKYKNPVKEVGVTSVYGVDEPTLFENGDFTYVGERAITPRKYIDELHGAEKSIFKRLYAGRVSQKLYRLYEYEKL